jgi:serine protease
MKRFLVALLAALVVVPATVSWAAGDPLRKDQWALTHIDAVQAWGTAKGAGATIAIVDTGIDLSHPDLKSKIVSAWTCIDSCKAGGNDDNGHGSHVAGIAAAVTDNGEGVSGVAPKAKLIAVKVLDKNGKGFTSDVALGIKWAADKGARVVNLSLGPEVGLSLDVLGAGEVSDAVDYAWNKGAVVVAAAGNDALPFTSYTFTANLLVVGATGPDDRLASYSTAGAGVDVYAPGGDATTATCTKRDCIVSAYKDGGYATMDGTSMATPQVSGIAALLRSQGRNNSQTVSRIKSTTEDSADGFPRVNAAKAVGAPATGGGSGGGSGGGDGGGTGGGSGGGSSSPGGKPSGSPTSSSSPRASTTPSTTPSSEPSGVGPQAGGPGGGEGDLASSNRVLGLIVILGIAGAVYASNYLRRRGRT